MEQYFTEQVYFVLVYRGRCDDQTFGTKEGGEALVKDKPGLGEINPNASRINR